MGQKKNSAAPTVNSESSSDDGSAISKKKRNYLKENVGKVTFDHNGKVLTVKEPQLNVKVVHAGVNIDASTRRGRNGRESSLS